MRDQFGSLVEDFCHDVETRGRVTTLDLERILATEFLFIAFYQ